MERRQQITQQQQQTITQHLIQQQQQLQLQAVAASAAETPDRGATMTFTPQQDGAYDPNVYLQVRIRGFIPILGSSLPTETDGLIHHLVSYAWAIALWAYGNLEITYCLL